MSFEEKLVEFVRENKCLYVKTDRDYKNNLKKEKLWGKISSDLGIPGDKLKARWKSLRNTYRMELKKIREAPSGSGAAHESRWRFFDLMSFLEGSIPRSQTTSNYSRCEELSHEGLPQDEVASFTFEDNLVADEIMSSTTCTYEESNLTISASGEIPVALRLSASSEPSRGRRESSKNSSLEDKYEDFLKNANDMFKKKDMSSPFGLFMQSMTCKVEKNNLRDEQVDELQEAVLYVINKKLQKFRETNKS